MNENEENKRDTKTTKSGLGRISRRKFTIGSVAVISSSPLALGGMDTPALPFKIEMDDDVRQIMEDRHILESDLALVIQYAERTGEKLYREDSDHLMAKFKVNTVYFYAEYSPIEGGYRIHNTYSHRFTLEGTM
jgi:hypothetical protein